MRKGERVTFVRTRGRLWTKKKPAVIFILYATWGFFCKIFVGICCTPIMLRIYLFLKLTPLDFPEIFLFSIKTPWKFKFFPLIFLLYPLDFRRFFTLTHGMENKKGRTFNKIPVLMLKRISFSFLASQQTKDILKTPRITFTGK